MATLGYSSLFSSGLLAADPELHSSSRSHTPDPTTPRSRATTLNDTTPTAPTYALPATASSSNVLPALATAAEITDTQTNYAGSERPCIRRRRSSLSLSASPVAAFKCNAPSARASAAVHMQRQSLTTNRSRAGSASETGVMVSRAALTLGNGDAAKGNSIIGRLRSGSVGTALRPRRLRKQATLPTPAPPPPTAPLPPLPGACLPLPTLNIPAEPHTPRRPLSRRSQTADAIPVPIHTPKVSFASAEHGGALDMEVDCPSPIDTPGRVRGGYF